MTKVKISLQLPDIDEYIGAYGELPSKEAKDDDNLFIFLDSLIEKITNNLKKYRPELYTKYKKEIDDITNYDIDTDYGFTEQLIKDGLIKEY